VAQVAPVTEAERARRLAHMTEVNSALAQKLSTQLGVSPRHVNRLIDAIVREHHLTRQQAAIVLASRRKVNFSRFAAAEDLAAIRTAGGFANHPVATPAAAAPAGRGRQVGRIKKEPSNSVFVVHGRSEQVRRDLFDLLRKIGLNPIEWNAGKQLTKKASPHNAEVIAAIIKKAAGAVVLFCPEEKVRLKRDFWRSDDPAEERQMTEQPRPNVLYEAGMAFAAFPASTVIVRVGRIRSFTDLAGVQIINLTGGTVSGRQAVATALRTAKLPVNTGGQDWLTEGGFAVRSTARKAATT
jgi:predicted nucleotide-binding protein